MTIRVKETNETSPRIATARLVSRCRMDLRIRDKELVEERCPASDLFARAGLAPVVTWSISPSQR